MTDFNKVQLHAGINQRKTDQMVWHTNSKGNYWCGDWYTRTPRQLMIECMTTLLDLKQNNPELNIKIEPLKENKK